MKKTFLFGFFFILVNFVSLPRTVYRPPDPCMPYITVNWVNDKTTYKLSSYHLDEYPLFELFDKNYLEKHQLPKIISPRYKPETKIETAKLSTLIEEVLQEIAQGKQQFKNFKILTCKDFNFKTKYGLIILKFKDYPFVVKLFIETPQGFVRPFDKGIEPIFFFFMGRGASRHLSGFTRLKNREYIKAHLEKSPWATVVDVPRKWYWLPSNAKWIEIKGFNFKKRNITTQFPGTYCIIADAIEAERIPSLWNNNDKKLALNICNYLDLWVDPHMKNFMFEKQTQKFVIVDTEHFPSFTGLKEKIKFNSYLSWYVFLAMECFKTTFLQTKLERRNPRIRNRSMRLS